MGGDADAPTDDGVGVPLFWPLAMRNCQSLHGVMSERDWKVLEHLTSVRVEPWDERESVLRADDSDDGEGGEGGEGGDIDEIGLLDTEPGFSLHFHFAPGNPYLRSEELVIYCYGAGEVADATAPEWKTGQDVTVKEVVKKVKKKKGAVSKQRVLKPVDSFFRIFAVPDIEEGYDDDGGDDDGAMSVYEMHEHLVPILREDLVPRAGLYFAASLQPGGDDDDDFWKEQGMDGLDLEEDWDLEEDYSEPKKKKGKPKRY